MENVRSQEETKQVVAKIWHLVEPVIRNEAMELVEVEYRREPHGWVLRLYIDQEGGITMEDCVRVNRVISDLLDVVDPISHAYHLEVSSPGLDRPLRKWEHFAREVGNIIRVVTQEPIRDRKKFTGLLLEAQPERIALDCDGEIYLIPLSAVDRAKLRFFDSQKHR